MTRNTGMQTFSFLLEVKKTEIVLVMFFKFFQTCVLLGNKHWEQKNPTSTVIGGIRNEAGGNSQTTDYLASTFIKKKLECYWNELSYVQYDFRVKLY